MLDTAYKIYGGLAILLQTIEAKENDTEPTTVITRKRKDSFERSKEDFVASILQCDEPVGIDNSKQSQAYDYPFTEDEEFYADDEETSSETEDFEPFAKRKKD